jgi:imidazolonepropionase-like amidohydrolase
MRLLLHPDWLIDGSGSDVREGEAVVVNDGAIEAVGPVSDLENLTGLTTIRLECCSLLPGLINFHVHLNLPGDNTSLVPWLDGQSDAALAVRSAANARRCLVAGITSLRDCGGRGTTVLATRDAVRDGLASGAAIVSCGWPITITGGHTRHMGAKSTGRIGCDRWCAASSRSARISSKSWRPAVVLPAACHIAPASRARSCASSSRQRTISGARSPCIASPRHRSIALWQPAPT